MPNFNSDGVFVRSSLNVKENEKEAEKATAELQQSTPTNASDIIAKNEVKRGNHARNNRNDR